jgi:hypothetical protein
LSAGRQRNWCEARKRLKRGKRKRAAQLPGAGRPPMYSGRTSWARRRRKLRVNNNSQPGWPSLSFGRHNVMGARRKAFGQGGEATGQGPQRRCTGEALPRTAIAGATCLSGFAKRDASTD